MSADIVNSVISFLSSPTSGDTSNAIRQAARQRVQQRVGSRIWAGFIPQDAEEGYQATVEVVSVTRYQHLFGEDGLVESHVQVSCWGWQPGARAGVWQLGEDIRQSLTDYCGPMAAHVIDDCRVSFDGMRTALRPPDNSDDWLHVYITDYKIHHDQTTPNE